jgi:hypothetical protein
MAISAFLLPQPKIDAVIARAARYLVSIVVSIAVRASTTDIALYDD